MIVLLGKYVFIDSFLRVNACFFVCLPCTTLKPFTLCVRYNAMILLRDSGEADKQILTSRGEQPQEARP